MLSIARYFNSNNAVRGYASLARCLLYEQHGEPEDVVKLVERKLSAHLAPDELLLKMLAAPINPSDINMIQGKYPLQPPLPAVPGNEGVAQVVDVGQQVYGLQPGDWVVPLEMGQGTWRTGGMFSARLWHKVPKSLPMDFCATLCVNLPTAMAMLQQFADLKAGDVVVQNGATSAVGQAVIQIAKARGIHTVNIIREQPNHDEVVANLKALGADVVTTEDRVKEEWKASGLPEPALGLNCVGGPAALAAAKLLRPGSTLVTYGGMSMLPISIPTSLLVFKDITFKGFWLSGRWTGQHGLEGKAAMIDSVIEMAMSGKIVVRAKLHPFAEYQDALKLARAGHRGFKVLLDMSNDV